MRALAQDDSIIEGQAEDISALSNEIDADERSILADFGAEQDKASWEIKVYKRGEGNQRGWVVDIDPSQLPFLSKLRRMAGPGSYQGYCYRDKKLRKVLKWNIVELVEQPQAAAADSALGQLVTQQGKLLNEMMAQIVAIKQAPPAPPPQQSNMMEMMGLFTQMAAVFKQDVPPPPPAKDPMEMLTGTLALARELANGDKEKSTLEIVADMIASPMVQETLRSVAGAAQAARAAPPAPPPGMMYAPRIASPPPMQTAQPIQVAPAASPMPFAQEIAFLLVGAQKDVDPQSYADVCLAMMDPVVIAQLLAMPDPISLLITANPNIEPYRGWFMELFEALTAEPEGDEPSVNAVGSRSAPVPIDHHSGRSGGGEGDAEADEPEGEGR